MSDLMGRAEWRLLSPMIAVCKQAFLQLSTVKSEKAYASYYQTTNLSPDVTKLSKQI